MPYDRTPTQRNGRHPKTGPSRLVGLTAAATIAAVASDSATNPDGYRNAEVELVLHTSTRIRTRPSTPNPSSRLRATGPTGGRAERVGQTIARAAPIKRPKARVSVPS